MKQEVKFVAATIVKKTLSIKIMNGAGQELSILQLTAPAEKDEALFAVINAAIDNAEQDDTLVFVTGDPRAESLYELPKATEDKWLDILESVTAMGLSVATMKPGDPSYRPPIRYADTPFVLASEDIPKSADSTEVKMEELQALSGQLANNARLFIDDEESEAYSLGAAPKIFKVYLVYQLCPGTELIEDPKTKQRKLKLDVRMIATGETRLTRFFEEVEDSTIKVTELQTISGTIKPILGYTKVYRLKDKVTGELNPMVVFEGKEQPRIQTKKNELEVLQWQKSIVVFRDGFSLDSKRYQFGFISAAGQRTVTAVFLRSSIKVPEDMLQKIPEDYRMDKFASLSEIEKIYDILSYGGYLKLLNTEGVANKINTRFGMALSTSNGLGSIKARTMGRVIVPYSEQIEEGYRSLLTTQYGFDPERVERNIEILRRNWKEDAVDGWNFITTEKAVELLNAAGIRTTDGQLWNFRNAIGLDLQFRYAFVKGMATSMPRDLLWGIHFMWNGEDIYPFKDFDLICEKNSVKNEWAPEVYVGDLAPSFELVGMSKEKGSGFVDPQLITCCKFEKESDPEILKAAIKKNIDEMVEECNDIRIARVRHGVIGHSYQGTDKLHPYKRKPRSILEGGLQALDQESGPIEEPFLVKNIAASHFGMSDRAERGKFAVEGERCHMVPDFSVIWKGQYKVRKEIDFLSGLSLLDLMVTDRSQAILGFPEMVWACGKVGKLALYRNPLNRPGEIVFAEGTPLEMIDDEWAAEIFSHMKNAVVLSVFSASANLMGGGDFDGDLAMVLADENLLKLLKPDDFVFVEVETTAKKIIVTYENLKNAIANSLCSPGIGLVTNYGSTWAEVAHVIRWFMITKPKQVRLPKCMYPNWNEDPEAPQYRQQNFGYVFLRNLGDKPNQKGLSVLAAEALHLRGANMPEWEREACGAIAALRDDHLAPLLKKDSLTYAEFETLAIPFMKACEGGTNVVRYLQELAINTAKSDVWAFYVRNHLGELVPDTKYSYIAMDIRPFWKRNPNRYKTFEADYTPMGLVNKYTGLVFDSIFKNLLVATRPIPALSDAPKNTQLYQTIDKMVLEYNAAKKALAIQRANASSSKDEDAIMKKFSLLNVEYRNKASVLLYGNDICDVLRAAYTATYTHADREKGTRMSFVYSVFGDEFLAWLNNSSKSDQMVPIPVTLLEGVPPLHAGTYDAVYDLDIKRTIIISNDVPVGIVPCKLPESAQITVFIDGDRAFAQVYVPRVVKKVANKDFGRQVRILGLSDYGFSERKVLDTFRAKVGMNIEAQAFRLGEHQDIVRFVESSIDKNGIAMPCISVRIGSQIVGNVAPEYIPYVHQVMSYGDLIVVEWSKSGRGFSDKSVTIKVIDAIVR